ncbi:DoxX family protein [Streptomyces sp. NPDC050560]|uniref:DoxX family protein n=1 Tax=Streptomyces sp. NPDC050560 TaxID=3365630 RepID=UPI0037A07FC0
MNQLDRLRPHVLGLFRIVVALLFFLHGVSTLFHVLAASHGARPSVGEWPGWWAALIQFVTGAFVLLGLGTRSAALVGSGSMAFAYFTEHQPHGLLPIQNGGEPAVMFCWALLLIVFLGPGSLTLGTVLTRLRGAGGVPAVVPPANGAPAAAAATATRG